MSRKSRLILILLFATLSGGLGLGIVALNTYEDHESAQLLAQVRHQREDMLKRLIILKGESLSQLIHEYVQWNEMVNFVQADVPDIAWVKNNLYPALEAFKAESAWVLRPDGSLYYSIDASTFPEGNPPPLPPFGELAPHFQNNKGIHFFYETGDSLYEIRGSPIVPFAGLTKSSIPRGYLIIGRKWDAAYLGKLASLTDSSVVLDQPGHIHQMKECSTEFHLHRPLPGLNGKPYRALNVHYISDELKLLNETNHWEVGILLGYGMLVIFVVNFVARRWVLRPLSQIKTSLALGSIKPVEYLLNEDAEFGRVARLVRRSFEDRRKLTESLEERDRLGRDLHDGMIQTLYATGMTMTSIRRNIRQDPDTAESLIDQTRSELNAAIRDVRLFISRLEIETEPSRSFDEAVKSLLEFMRGGRDLIFTTEIDSKVAALFPMDIRAQLLQIIREATSNAIRHGQCHHLQVTLRNESDHIQLEITDDGLGFDPKNTTSNGQGIRNFRERALELDATLDIISRLNQGARIIFRLHPLPRP